MSSHTQLILLGLYTLIWAAKAGTTSPQSLFGDSKPDQVCPLNGLTHLLPSRDHHPWTHVPRCFQPAITSSRGRSPDNEAYCIYTGSTFRSESRITFITKPAIASYLAEKSVINPKIRSQVDQERLSEADHAARDAAAQTWPAYEALARPGRGFGLFANRTISEGEVIIVDFPHFILLHEVYRHLSEEQRQEAQWTALLSLPPSTQRELRNLAKSRDGDEIDAVMGTNSVGQVYGREGGALRHVGLPPLFAVSRGSLV